MESKLNLGFENFSKIIHQKCAMKKNENIFLSPLSIQTAITLALIGAHGNTLEELKSILNYNTVSENELKKHFIDLMKIIDEDECIEIANKFYGKIDLKFKNDFKEIIIKDFRSDIENVDFTKTHETAGKINEWVESKTNKKIQNFIDPTTLPSHTKLIIINAIYFKANWFHNFDKQSTDIKTFWLDNDKEIDVQMMYHKKSHEYAEIDELDCKALDMVYRNSNMKMIFLLPNKRNGLAELEDKLKNIEFTTILDKMMPKLVETSIPKFKFTFEISLKDTLTEMGMKSLFENADFSKMLDGEKFSVDDVLHKTYINVNEDGTEAAAVTAMRLLGCSLQREKFTFNADHPFYFCLYHNELEKIVFSGRVISPSY